MLLWIPNEVHKARAARLFNKEKKQNAIPTLEKIEDVNFAYELNDTQLSISIYKGIGWVVYIE